MNTPTQNETTVISPPAPVTEANRITTIDMLRGIALLGILVMNIPGFAMAEYSSEAYRNDPSKVDFWLNAFITVFLEGKMRAMFGMVFGAGVLLFVASKEQSGKKAHGLFYRRMFWLVLFGIIHAHVILWLGDILYLYGICGMLVYLFRNVKPKYLAIALPLVALVDFTSGALFYGQIRQQRIAYVSAQKARDQHQTLSPEQTKALEDWRKLEKSLIPNREDVKANTQKMKSNYADVASRVRPLSFQFETQALAFELWDSVALMFLGMALYKWGFLTAGWSKLDYQRVAALGYGIGLPLVMFSFYYNTLHYSTLEANLARMEQVPVNWVSLIYPFQRILLVMAHASTAILIFRSGFAQAFFGRLQAVGRMAFTNYIMHSVICSLFFFGYGLNFYAELQFHQLYYLVIAIWIVQLIASPIWLRYFYFGPLEWMWRSLTYWRPQKFRRSAAAPALAA